MQKQFDEVLNKFHKLYDEKESLLCYDEVFSDYHSKWRDKAHIINDSLAYAVALLQRGIMPERADDIIKRIISLQDLREGSHTYGLWSWYLEESLDEMAPPDFNWADFCSTKLMLATTFGYDKEIVKEAVIAACECIIKRDVQPTYMNIAALGAFATLFAGQLYDHKRIFDYGKERLKKFYDFHKYNEYNSPTYIMFLIKILTYIKREIIDKDCVDMAESILDDVWGMVAVHFHPETMQWSGPMTRAYSSLLKPNILGSIMFAVFGDNYDGDVVIGLEDYSAKIECPQKYRHYFEKTDEPRFISENFIDDCVANTYITPNYSIGSFESSDMWNQRRALLAFWGNVTDIKYLNLRVLHDGYDYAAATLHSKQTKGVVEGYLVFETEGGDTHPDLNRIKDAKIRAKDFRVIFEFYNSPPRFVSINKAVFDGKQITSQITSRGIELELYSGEETVIDFASIGESRIEFKVDMDI